MLSKLIKVVLFIVFATAHIGAIACVGDITNASIIDNSMVEVKKDVVRVYIKKPKIPYELSSVKISYRDRISVTSKFSEFSKNGVNYLYLVFETYEGQLDEIRLNLSYTKASTNKNKSSLCMVDRTINVKDIQVMEK